MVTATTVSRFPIRCGRIPLCWVIAMRTDTLQSFYVWTHLIIYMVGLSGTPVDDHANPRITTPLKGWIWFPTRLNQKFSFSLTQSHYRERHNSPPPSCSYNLINLAGKVWKTTSCLQYIRAVLTWRSDWESRCTYPLLPLHWYTTDTVFSIMAWCGTQIIHSAKAWGLWQKKMTTDPGMVILWASPNFIIIDWVPLRLMEAGDCVRYIQGCR